MLLVIASVSIQFSVPHSDVTVCIPQGTQFFIDSQLGIGWYLGYHFDVSRNEYSIAC